MGLDLVIVCQEKIHIWDLEPIFIELLENMGIENFRKDILRVCKTREDVSDLERWIVTEELVKNLNCYNQRVGGDDSDSFYGKVLCIDTVTNKCIKISKEEFYSSDRYKGISSGYVLVRYKCDVINRKYFYVTIEEYHNNKYLYSSISEGNSNFKGRVSVKDKYGNSFSVYKTDPRYISGELVSTWKGKFHSEESKTKISKANSINQKGSKNSMYGKVSVSNGLENKSINKEDLEKFLKENTDWKRGKHLNTHILKVDHQMELK